VKHFKILVIHFSTKVSWYTGVVTKAATFKDSRSEALWS